MQKRLKRCPFCGGEPVIKTQKCDFGISGTTIKCSKCTAHLYILDQQATIIENGVKNMPVNNHKELAINAWNSRIKETNNEKNIM